MCLLREAGTMKASWASATVQVLLYLEQNSLHTLSHVTAFIAMLMLCAKNAATKGSWVGQSEGREGSRMGVATLFKGCLASLLV